MVRNADSFSELQWLTFSMSCRMGLNADVLSELLHGFNSDILASSCMISILTF
jgi:hypothetical protein